MLNKIYLPDYNPNLLESPKVKEKTYSYNEKEIKDLFEKIKDDILDNKPVDAQININKLKLSNASISVKSKMDILQSFIDKPDYARFKNKISLDDVKKEISLFDNIYILWTGTVKNHKLSKEEIRFDLVVGNEEKGIIEGVIPVILKKEKILKNNEIVAVFGKIKIKDGGFFILADFIIKDENFIKNYTGSK